MADKRLNLHAGGSRRPCKCDNCDRSKREKRSLDFHWETAHSIFRNDRNVVCNICGYRASKPYIKPGQAC